MRKYRHRIYIPGFIFSVAMTACVLPLETAAQKGDYIQAALDSIPELRHERGKRLPLYLGRTYLGQPGEQEAEKLIREFDARGIGLYCLWSQDKPGESIESCLTVARAQKKTGCDININATRLMYSFFNGDEQTAHIDKNGSAFFDESFPKKRNMGCPFAIDHRKNEIRKRMEFYLDRYAEEGLAVDFIFLDWEIDGPLEVNRAYEASKKCTRCREHLGDDFSFTAFQKTMREMRSYLQYYTFSAPVLSRFPDALAGNYAVYPNDGYRYWYDFFEYYVEGQPYKADHHARYRQWYDDFPATGYTCATAVVYPWFRMYDWYDFDNTDYRWFYNMLLVASNAGKSTPRNIPLVCHVSWNIIWVDYDQTTRSPDLSIRQMSEESYQELLWHMLLRGTDALYVYSGGISAFPKEARLVHEVYEASLQYKDFLEHGWPVSFEVPDKPGTVVSGLILGDRVLVRRTDFGTNTRPVELLAGTKLISVKYKPGVCQIIDLK